MKHLAILIVMLLLSSPLIAQDFQGIATYKSKRQIGIEFGNDRTDVGGDEMKMDSGMQKKMMEMLKKQFEKTYILTFNEKESVFKEEKSLEAPQSGGAMVMIFVGSDESGELYKNIKEERYTDKNEMFGKLFLIQDKLQKLDWKLENETKNIGEYTCYKATLHKERPKERGFGEQNDDENKEPEMEEYTVTAWYTPQIPVSSGPRSYHGLPGLILEINDGSETMICSKIVLNPKDKLSISEPSKGKKVNQKEFDEIMEKKMKEMNDRYHHDRDDAHNTFDIRIRG